MNELPDNPISATVDFAREGVQHGFLKLPYSRDDSAWGAVMIPLSDKTAGHGTHTLAAVWMAHLVQLLKDSQR